MLATPRARRSPLTHLLQLTVLSPQDELVGVHDFVAWGSASKDLSDMWLGRSPELEIGLFTACYVTRGIYVRRRVPSSVDACRRHVSLA